MFGSNIQSITPITKSPVGKDLLPQERKHQMWSMAVDNVLYEEIFIVLLTLMSVDFLLKLYAEKLLAW